MARALEDRRAARPSPAPYLTDEGFVLFDRREFGERRKQSFDSLAQLLKIGIPANRG
jgi:hypothetical protein